MPPIILALCSNISFASASILFTEYSKRISPSWMNFYKAFVAMIAFALVCTIAGFWLPISTTSTWLLIASGFCGLMIGDIFMLKGFIHLGSGRVLMLFSFQPLLLGVVSYYLWGQQFQWLRLTAILFLILCIVSFSFESFKSKGHWDGPGLAYALTGVLLDAFGVLMTRAAFESTPDMSPFLANFIRAATAASGFVVMSLLPIFSFSLFAPLKKLNVKDRGLVTLAGFFGTFMSLSFYLMAIKKGHLATVSAVAGTAPLFATVIEVGLGKRKFTPYLGAGLLFFIIGFTILIANFI